jgi:hypothetical protein
VRHALTEEESERKPFVSLGLLCSVRNLASNWFLLYRKVARGDKKKTARGIVVKLARALAEDRRCAFFSRKHFFIKACADYRREAGRTIIQILSGGHRSQKQGALKAKPGRYVETAATGERARSAFPSCPFASRTSR